MTPWKSKRDAAAENYLENDCYAMDGYVPHRDTYKAGWDAATAELLKERDALQSRLDELTMPKIPTSPYERELAERCERYRLALERIAKIKDDWGNGAVFPSEAAKIAREALKPDMEYSANKPDKEYEINADTATLADLYGDNLDQ